MNSLSALVVSAEAVKLRLHALRQWLSTQSLDALVVACAVNRAYVSGFTGSVGYAVVSKETQWLFVDGRYGEQAQREAPLWKIVLFSGAVEEVLHTTLCDHGIRTLGYEAAHVTVATYERYRHTFGTDITLVQTSQAIESLRAIKSVEEQGIMRRAIQLADDAYAHVLPHIRPGVRERDIAWEIEQYMRTHGATGTSFEIIVASGERAALPHGIATDKRIAPQEFVVLDFGARVGGYCSDLTRTVFVGEPTALHRHVYEIVFTAQQAVIEALRPAMTGQQADAVARAIIAQHGYADCFVHSTGHAVGLDIHEWPTVSARETSPLQVGHVLTVEPGIYISGWGGVRIEDIVVITPEGCEVLSHSPKAWTVIPW